MSESNQVQISAGAVNKTAQNQNINKIQRNINKGKWAVRTCSELLVKKKSDVWNTLMVILDDQNSVLSDFAWCPLCNKVLRVVASKATSGLRGHVNKCKAALVSNDLTEVNLNQFNRKRKCQPSTKKNINFFAIH